MAVKGFARAIIIVTTISAAIMELIDTSIVNVALTNISGSLGATIEDTSWVITAYAIANVIIIPMTGFLQQFFGRKNYYIASIIIFTIASYMCGTSGSLWVLVFWRFVQGIGGGALLSTSQGILFDAFEPAKRAVASGLFGMGIVIGHTIGPILGGYIIDHASWPLIFNVNIPFGIVATLLCMRYVEKQDWEHHVDRKNIHIDLTGILFLAIGVGSLQFVLERGEADDWYESHLIRYLTATAILGLAAFIWWELRERFPVINLRVLKNMNLIGSNILTFVGGFGLFGSVYIFPVLVQRVMGYTPTDAGLGIIPGALMGVVLMPIVGVSIGKGVKPIYFVVLGFIAFILHGYLCAQANIDSGISWFIIPQILRGVGAACLIIPLISQSVIGLTPKEMPYGIALTNMLRQLGGAFGIAVMNTYIIQRYALHRADLISNLNTDAPALASRLSSTQQYLVAHGASAANANTLSYKFLDLAVDKQSYLLSYLDAFMIVAVFFVCAIPFMFLLRTENKTDKATQAKIAEEAH